MNRKPAGILGAAVLAVVGTVLLVLYVDGAEDRAALEGEEVVTVLVASERIPAGTPSSEMGGLVEQERVAVKVAGDDAIADLADLDGVIAAVDLLPGDVLKTGRFVSREQFQPQRGTVEVPENFLEVTISVSAEGFVGGIPVPGNRVAVVGTFNTAAAAGSAEVSSVDSILTKMVLQQALVTNVQGAAVDIADVGSSDRAGAPSGGYLVTFALEGPDVERLVFAEETGVLHLALHSSDAIVESRVAIGENVFG